MTLSTTVFGGESPNDRISTILAVMTSISERVDNLVGKVGNMESKVEEIVQEETEMKEEMKTIKIQMDTKMNSVSNKLDKVAQDLNIHGWIYLGRGHLIGGVVRETLYTGTTLSQCFQICEAKHSADHQWNGFIWDPSNRACYCEKNDQGLDPTHNQEYMHFLKQ